jgi:PhnB protein
VAAERMTRQIRAGIFPPEGELMKAFTPYLNFDGNTREAMTFYQKCLGAQLELQTFGEANAPFPGHEQAVMHARLTTGSAVIMASDPMPNNPVVFGNNVWITQECESIEEIERVFAAFAEGGKVVMPLADQFWGARFGMITDKFGINWMFNCQLPKK